MFEREDNRQPSSDNQSEYIIQNIDETDTVTFKEKSHNENKFMNIRRIRFLTIASQKIKG